MTPEFVDPRANPEPPSMVSREPAAHGEELRELVQLCAAGHVYDVERWIQDGRPIQALTYKRPGKASVISPLCTAIRKKHRDVVFLLLCNGYRLDLEAKVGYSVLDEALSVRAFDIVDLLLLWGSDPTGVSTDCLDYTTDPEFVRYLAQTVNKPLYGWLRRNRADQRLQDALDVALLEAVMDNAELPVRLLLWAGADPHRKVPAARELGRPDAWDPDLVSSSAETAIVFGRHELLDLLRVDRMPNLEGQAARAHDSGILKKLVALRPPTDWSGAILTFVRLFCPPWEGRSWDARDALQFIASSGGRLTTVPANDLRFLRRGLLDLSNADDFLWLIRWLKNEKHCEPPVYAEVTRTTSMRKKIEALNAGARYLTPHQKMSRAAERRRRTAERKATP